MNIIILLSCVCGVVSSVLPNLLLKLVYYRDPKFAPRQVLRNLYLGTVLKYLFMSVLFGLCLLILKVMPSTFFLGYILSEAARWLGNWLRLPRIEVK